MAVFALGHGGGREAESESGDRDGHVEGMEFTGWELGPLVDLRQGSP